MDVFAVQDGLAVAAQRVAGLRCYPTLPDSIAPPTFAPVEMDLSYHQTFGGLTEILFTCQLCVSRGDTDTGRKALLAYLAPTGAASIPAAIEADKTLGGAVGSLTVERVRGAGRLYTIGALEYLGAQFEIRVWG